MKIGKTIYLDHQATTPIDEIVMAKMAPYFSHSFGNPHSSDHCLGWESLRALENATEQVAKLIGADTDEIIFTSGATESNNIALLGLARRASRNKRRRILISSIEHKCVLAIGRILKEKLGFKVEKIPVDKNGFLNTSALEKALDEDVLAVSIIAANNEIGTIQDIKKISGLVKKYEAIFHCDAAQAPMAIKLGSIANYVDTLSLSSHKMYGPKGIGIIYISRGLQKKIEPIIYGGGQQNGLRSGTVPVPLCVGMGAAAELMSADEADNKRLEMRKLRNTFINGLENLPWPIKLNGPRGEVRHSGNINARFVGFSAHDILNTLQPHLAASTGSACTSGFPEPSHVLKAIGLNDDDSESSIRFSLGFGTKVKDIEDSLVLIEETLSRLSKAGLQRFA